MFNRRGFLQGLSTLPGLGGLGAFAGTPKRDYFKELGVRTFINAAGTFTALTASLMPKEVMEAIQYASRHYVSLSELQDAVGAKIASLLGAEGAMVTSGAAGALTCGAAACVAGKNPEFIRRLPDLTGMKTECIMQKSHRFGYDHAVRAVGLRMVEIETPEELERAAGPQAALMLYLNSADEKGLIKREQWVALGKKQSVPTFIDAAADTPPVDNLKAYTRMGFDLTAFSGGKGICGPQSAGLLFGRKDLIEAARMNTSPNSDTIARGMKVNKEEILGMLVALELYLRRDHAADLKEWERRADVIARAARKVPSVTAEVKIPPVANHVPHLHIRWDQAKVRLTPKEVMQQLREGTPSIEANPATSKDELVFSMWMMQPGEAEVVARRVQQVLNLKAA